jgi:hypothetical protein
MNTLPSPSKRSRFPESSEILFLLLLLVSLVEVGGCLNASRLLLESPASVRGAAIGPIFSTNAPMIGGHLAPTAKSSGFQSRATRG